jgi:hypothetical protein
VVAVGAGTRGRRSSQISCCGRYFMIVKPSSYMGENEAQPLSFCACCSPIRFAVVKIYTCIPKRREPVSLLFNYQVDGHGRVSISTAYPTFPQPPIRESAAIGVGLVSFQPNQTILN